MAKKTAKTGKSAKAPASAEAPAPANPAQIEQLENEELYVDSANEVPPSDIVAYNELRSCADLERMARETILDIQPDFQRDFVWPAGDQTRFIDSLTKQLPIPSMCFAFDFKQNKWLVIDGLQRISTIIRFLSGDDWKLSKLDDIDPALAGQNAATIKNSKGQLNQFYSRVQNTTLPINVLRCDFTKQKHTDYLFMIFHRLNSGGVKLNNQEIRNCIYGGSFNQTLRDLDQNADWRLINSMKPDTNYRFTKQEAILRFFAFEESASSYNGLISKFLNDYMFKYRNANKATLGAKRELFSKVVSLIKQKIFPDPPTSRIPVTVLEALMVGVAANLDYLKGVPAAQVEQMYKSLREDDSVSEASLAEGLSKKDKVSARLTAAKKIFGP